MIGYKKTKSYYRSLCQMGRGKPPYRFLVIGGGRENLYGDGFFEVGDHPTANYGRGGNWHTNEFWKGLNKYLFDNRLSFDAMIIDDGSFSWILENHDKIFEHILTIFEMYLSENGVMIITAYSARRMLPHMAHFYDMVSGTDMFEYADPGEFYFSDDQQGDVFRMFQRKNAVVPFTNLTNIWKVDLDNKLIKVNQNDVLLYDGTKKAVNEKTIIEFIKTRFKNTKTCPACTFENDLKNKECEICSTSIPEQPAGRQGKQLDKQPAGRQGKQPDIQPDRRPGKQSDKQPDRQPDRRSDRQSDRQPDRQTDSRPAGRLDKQPDRRPAGRPAGRLDKQPDIRPAGRPAGRLDKQPDIQPGKQSDRQPDRQPDGRPDRQPDRRPYRRPDGRPDSRLDKQPDSRLDKQPDGQTDGQQGRQSDRRQGRQSDRRPGIQPDIQCMTCTFANKASSAVCEMCDSSLHGISESAPEPLPARHQTSGRGRAVCVDLSDAAHPRVMVCLLYVVKNPDHVRKIRDIEKSDLKTVGDLFKSLSELKEIPYTMSPCIDLNATLSSVRPSASLFINQNMRLIKYGGGDDIMEATVLLERTINGDLPERLKNMIISETLIALDQKHATSNVAFWKQPTYRTVQWNVCQWVHTVLIVDTALITDHVSIMFNYWLSGRRLNGFQGDIKFPLVGMFDNMGCIQQMPPDTRDPTQNVIFGRLTVVEQHVHLEDGNYNLGADMARIKISEC